jgi:hypothetical protein
LFAIISLPIPTSKQKSTSNNIQKEHKASKHNIPKDQTSYEELYCIDTISFSINHHQFFGAYSYFIANQYKMGLSFEN